jgi:hypothetical protein
MPWPASSVTRAPVLVEPVKETTLTSGCWMSGSPAPAPPFTMLTTPSGKPASSRHCTKL